MWTVLGLAHFVTGCSPRPKGPRSHAPGKGSRFALLTSFKPVSRKAEAKEIALGRRVERIQAAKTGVYPDRKLLAYVTRVGKRIAAVTPRPRLPWTFRVLDASEIAAYAFPGGMIHVSRGMLSLVNSESELAAALAHEAAHVVLRHTMLHKKLARKKYKDMEWYLPMDSAALKILAGRMSAYSRKAELEADALAVWFLVRAGYTPDAMVRLLKGFERAEEKGGSRKGKKARSKYRTHPPTRLRIDAVSRLISRRFRGRTGKTGRAAHLRSIDGLLYGRNPERGYVSGSAYINPRAGLSFRLPRGWAYSHHHDVVAARLRADRTVLLFLPTEHRKVEDARDEINVKRTFQYARLKSGRLHGFKAVYGPVDISDSAQGYIAFIKTSTRVYLLIGAGPARTWLPHAEAVEQTVKSVAPLKNPHLLQMPVRQIRLVRVRRSTPLKTFSGCPSTALTAKALAILNGMNANTVLNAGQLLKCVVKTRRRFRPSGIRTR